MATYDTSYESGPQFQGHSINRIDRPLRISWSGIVGGTAIGWGLFSLLSLIGAAIGFAKFDPYSPQPANGLGAGSGIFGFIVLVVSSFLGLGAARTAAESTAMIASGPRAQAKAQREGNVRERNGGPTVQDRNRAS